MDATPSCLFESATRYQRLNTWEQAQTGLRIKFESCCHVVSKFFVVKNPCLSSFRMNVAELLAFQVICLVLWYLNFPIISVVNGSKVNNCCLPQVPRSCHQ